LRLEAGDWKPEVCFRLDAGIQMLKAKVKVESEVRLSSYHNNSNKTPKFLYALYGL